MLENTLPIAPLKLIAMESCKPLGQKVNDYIVSFRENTINEVTESPLYRNYKANNYQVDCSCPRFGSGEAKGILKETIRGTDLFIMTDVCNYSLTYTVNGHLNHMSPDDHYQDLKRIIAAATGKARRINVIMPFLYESRQQSVQEESLWTVLLHWKNWTQWAYPTSLHLMLMTHVYRMQFHLVDLTALTHSISS